MKPEDHRALQSWGEQVCERCGHDRAAHIAPRPQGVCGRFAAADPDDQ